MTKKQKKMLSRILISAVLFLLLYTVPAQGVVRLLLYLIPYAVIGWDVLWRAVKNIRNGQVFDENFLMSIATIGAFGCGEYPEAVAVMLFYQVGELFQSVAVGRSRQSIAALMDIRPDYANMERDGQLVQVDPDEVAVGDTIVIKAGERVPLDGIVTQGNSALDTAALTGISASAPSRRTVAVLGARSIRREMAWEVLPLERVSRNLPRVMRVRIMPADSKYRSMWYCSTRAQSLWPRP